MLELMGENLSGMALVLMGMVLVAKLLDAVLRHKDEVETAQDAAYAAKTGVEYDDEAADEEDSWDELQCAAVEREREWQSSWRSRVASDRVVARELDRRYR